MALSYQSPTRNLPDGYTFRGATFHDIPVAVHLFNLRQMADLGAGSFCVDDIRHEWQTPHFNPAMDVRLVFDRREHLIGYIEVWTINHPPVHPWLWGCVHPDFEGQGIGTTLLRWGEARVGLALDMLPVQQWIAPRFSTLPVQRAHELCEHLGWRYVPSSAQLRQEAKKGTGALHLPETADLQYDVYEKAIDQLN
ncbi:MAG: GNAT family N-acetyltransferase [Chloroflexi bacterium]|nr:MAG: GNAT family N-acetyltransferase [Chloroflexota bacterium]